MGKYLNFAKNDALFAKIYLIFVVSFVVSNGEGQSANCSIFRLKPIIDLINIIEYN